MDIEYPILQPFHENIFKITVSDPDITKEVEFVYGFWEEWMGNFLHPFGNDLYRAKKLDSILYCYMASQSIIFDWLSHSLMLGIYETVLRELRNILENFFLMYYLDIIHKENSVEEKYKILEELETNNKIPYGKEIFKKSEYLNWQYCYDLYKELSKHIHISIETTGKFALEIAIKGFPEALDIQYSQHFFLKCTTSWRKISMIAVSLVECLFENLQVDIKDVNPAYLLKTWGTSQSKIPHK